VTSTAALALILSSGAAGSQKTAAQMVRMARPGGTLVQVGNVAGETPFPLLAFTRKELQLVSVYHYANTFPAAIAAAASRQIDISQIISRIYDFEETGRAYEDGVRDKQSLVKAIIIVSS
jgi:L-iditol 2-dehydrogenase